EEIEASLAAAHSAAAIWSRLYDGPRPEELRQAQSELSASETDLQLAKEDFARASRLFRQNVLSQADYDAARTAVDRNQHRLAVNQAKLDLLLAGTRWEDLYQAYADFMKAAANYRLLARGTRQEDKDAAKARQDEAQGKLDELDANLKEALVTAPK